MSTQVQPTPDTQRGAGASKPAPPRIVIQYPTPTVDDGRYPVKRVVGDAVTIEADIFRDGHDILRAVIRYRGPGDPDWSEAEMRLTDEHLGGVRWGGSCPNVACSPTKAYLVAAELAYDLNSRAPVIGFVGDHTGRALPTTSASVPQIGGSAWRYS